MNVTQTGIKDQTLFIELNRIESKTYGLWFCLLELIIHYHRRYVQATFQGHVCVFMCSLSTIIILKKERRVTHLPSWIDVWMVNLSLRLQSKAG